MSDRPTAPLQIELLAPQRLPVWNPGVRGGIPETPNRMTLTAGYIQGFPDFTAALNAAIAAVPTPGAVVIPGRSEPYELTGPVRMRSGVVVRGEGPTRTVIHARLVRQGSGIDGSGFHPLFRFQGEQVATLQVAQPIASGATSIALEPHIWGARPEPGQLVILTMNNDPAHGWETFDWERRVRGQPLRAADVHDLNVTLDGAVRLDYALADEPEATLAWPIERAGLEDLRIVNDAATEANWTVAFWYAANCWLRNCEIEMVPDVAVWLWNSRWLTIESCHVHTARSFNGGTGYGVNIITHSADCLVTDCIFEALRHAMLAQFGASGNVFAYNYSRRPAMSDLAMHGRYGYMNLFEGNVGAQIYVDNAWGRSGEINTFFRNRLAKFEARYQAETGIEFTDYEDHTLEYIDVEGNSHRQNVLGNTLLDSLVRLRDCAETWVERNLALNLHPGTSLIDGDGSSSGTIDVNNQGVGLMQVRSLDQGFRPSLFLRNAPHFWPGDSKPWPATGADVDLVPADQRPTLPAQDRYARLPWPAGYGPRTPRLAPGGATAGPAGTALAVQAKGSHSNVTVWQRYLVDWGDNSVTSTALVRAGTAVDIGHTWHVPGTYTVRCQTRDQYGHTSRWSTGLIFNVA